MTFVLKVQVCWWSKAKVLRIIPTATSLAGSPSTYQVTITNRGDQPFPPDGRPVIFAFALTHPNDRRAEKTFAAFTPGQLTKGSSHVFPSVDVSVEENGYMHLTIGLRYPGGGELPLRILGLDDQEAVLTHRTQAGLVNAPDYNETRTSVMSSRWAEERSAVYTRWGLWLAAIGLLLSTGISWLTLAYDLHWWPFS